MRPQVTTLGWLAAAVIGAALSGCSSSGYTFTSAYDQSIRTVAVPVFRNETFRPGLETHLTEAVIKEIQRSTPWVVTSAADADTVLTGTIVGTDMRSMSLGRDTGLVQELAVRMVVDFTWINNRTGQPLLTRQDFAAAETFVPAITSGERLESGQFATVQELAREIVAELRSNW